MKKQMQFKGSIKFISCSPHGDPEGVVLDDGTFVKVPPHSLLNKELFEEGALISGEGELLTNEPNRVIHHARVKCGAEILADDTVDKDEREELKEKHKADNKKRKDAPSEDLTLTGKVVAIATKPKGEVDRIIFEDGTSIHVPKHVEIWAEDFTLGSKVEVEGEARLYKTGRFIKAESVRLV